ncbi:MAG TPA: AMP-binding protein [Pseudonocardia sp.]|uniref:AMP-binding protein n=1 Tax=Pseudonocardia sp. TaxID=60912 RepID=UPI002EDB3640
MTVDQETASVARATQQPATLPALLAGWAETLGDQRAFTFLGDPGYAGEPDGVSRSWSWRELDARVSTVATMLAGRMNPGERVAVLASQKPEYLAGFLGALRAGVIAVPLFTPRLPGHTGRLRAVLGDCRPALALTTRVDQHALTEFLGPYLGVVAVEDIPAAPSRDWPEADPHSVAYLRYQSGSARAPAAVRVTHTDLVANARASIEAHAVVDGRLATVDWQPLFHDLGLVLSIEGELS